MRIYFQQEDGIMNNKLEIWGGVECTVNRVQDIYFDQMKYNGHEKRLDDLDRFAAIGLKTLRFPFLWEKIAPEGVSRSDWSWTDERAQRLQELGIRPIAGLVHHGSGPRYTDLMDLEFPEKLAEFAKAVAERYPWIEDYTPINEQLTTARFSTLHGVWYPHHLNSYPSMFRALLNECRGTILSMQAIRQVNPKARLIQTDDLGKATSNPRLAYEAEFQNHRRWIGFDLLCGMVTPEHPLYPFMMSHGVSPEELAWFVENPCPPDIVGVNHYVLSNRYLDDRKPEYPDGYHSTNLMRDEFVDIETVRLNRPRASPKDLMMETWERYHLPIAITEVHIDAGHEEQMRWLLEVWNDALEARAEGADIRAITAWGLLGHYDWHCLVSRCEGYYESGVFDVRSPKPRPTLLAKVIHSLAETGTYQHPLLDVPGWWHRPDRLWFGKREPETFEVAASGRSSRPLLITGGGGRLGRTVARVCERRGIPYRLLAREELDIVDEQAVSNCLEELNPWAVVNAAGFVDVARAESEPEQCMRDNAIGSLVLSRACAERGIPMLGFSSAHVFDGEADSGYLESAALSPINTYGKSKAASEQAILENPGALLIRSGSFFGAPTGSDFLSNTLSLVQEEVEVGLPTDMTVSPSFLPDLVETSLNLLVDGETGIWHLSHPDRVSWWDFASEAAKAAHLNPRPIRQIRMEDLHLPVARPRHGVLSTERGILMPALDQALGRYAQSIQLRHRSRGRSGASAAFSMLMQ
jgi:dTDP-4-dehydrorhamnose reductase